MADEAITHIQSILAILAIAALICTIGILMKEISNHIIGRNNRVLAEIIYWTRNALIASIGIAGIIYLTR